MSDFPAFFYHLKDDGEIESRVFRYPREVLKGWTGDRSKLKEQAAKIKAKAPKGAPGAPVPVLPAKKGENAS